MANLENQSELSSLLPIHSDNGKQTISAKQLYDFLGLNHSAWSRWSKRNIIDNDFFSQGVDYHPLDIVSSGYGNSVLQDFEITIDFAKDLSMQARTAKGNNARKYFINCERKALEQSKPMSQLEMMQVSLNFHIEAERKIALLETRVNEQDAKLETLSAKQISSPIDYFTIAGYGSLLSKKIDVPTAAVLGKKASSICNNMGYMTGSVPDPRFGKVKTYPSEVLKLVFEKYFKK